MGEGLKVLLTLSEEHCDWRELGLLVGHARETEQKMRPKG